jgi:hypothetical protein
MRKDSNKMRRDLYTYVLACKSLLPSELPINVDSGDFDGRGEVPHV